MCSNIISAPVRTIAYTPVCSFQVFASSADGSIRAWDVKSGNFRKQFKGHNYQINCMQVSSCIHSTFILTIHICCDQ